MAQSSGRHSGDATGGMTEGVVDKAAEQAKETTETMAAAAQATAPMVRLVLDEAGPAMRDLVKAETDLASFWIELAREQMQRNVQTLQRLANTRDWREALEIQNDFVHQSMARMGQGLTRQMEMAGDMTSRWFDAGRESLKKAA